MIIIWHASSAPNQAAYGSDAEEVQFEKEYWRPRTTFKYVYSSFVMCPRAANGYLTRIARRYATSRCGDSSGEVIDIDLRSYPRHFRFGFNS